MTSVVLTPSAVKSTIRVRQTCFCGLLRSAAIASRRVRSAAFKSMVGLVRIRQTRTPRQRRESSMRLFRQILSTSKIERPTKAHFVLFTDLYEGGKVDETLARLRSLIG